jgi:hypothetical protein
MRHKILEHWSVMMCVTFDDDRRAARVYRCGVVELQHVDDVVHIKVDPKTRNIVAVRINGHPILKTHELYPRLNGKTIWYKNTPFPNEHLNLANRRLNRRRIYPRIVTFLCVWKRTINVRGSELVTRLNALVHAAHPSGATENL